MQSEPLEQRARIRDLGVQIGIFSPGEHNAITDVPGVEVGHVNVVRGDPPGEPGKGPARTGVTAIWPHRDGIFHRPVAAGTSVLNGTGEITTMTEINELGLLASPIMLTNSMQIGAVYDATVRYFLDRDPSIGRTKQVFMPAVGECDDSFLNDSRGMHVQAGDVWLALDRAVGGRVPEGCVGSGVGMTCFGFKGGIGTSSRLVDVADGTCTVGVLVMSNFGRRHRLTVAGERVGTQITDDLPVIAEEIPVDSRHGEGSAIVVVATDAPLTSHHLARLAKRATFGLIRTGSTGSNGSGEIALAFSTACSFGPGERHQIEMIDTFGTDPLFEATVDAAEEAVLNSMTMATTTTGRSGNMVHAIPLQRLKTILEKTGKLS